MKHLSIALIVCASLGARAYASEVATDDKHGIRMRLPDGYRVSPEGLAQPNTILAYVRGEAGAPGFEVLGVTTLGGTIGRESFDPTPIVQGIATAAGLTIVSSSRRQLRWKEFELDGFVATMRQGDQLVSLSGVQVPVRGEGVQIVILRLGEADVGGELQTVLAGFEADSNWLDTGARVKKLVTGGLMLLATIGFVTYIVIQRRQRARERR